MAKVTLAVRIRPFTERELRQEKSSEPVLRVEDEHTVSITNLKVATSGAGDSRLRVRRYNADFCLDDSCAQHQPNYVSQDTVYETVGRSVLETVGAGRSACVLAYGQSATGKTHTMLGSPEHPGLVPRLCRQLADDGGALLTVSFLEIYNERVRDLLCEEVQGAGESSGYNSLPRRRGNTVKDLRVREHPTKGPYVQNLRRVVVRGAEALLALVWTGAARRRAAATRRNPVSSRSHAVLQLSIGAAELHLADLAGSEKAGLEGSYRSRQKEGANINKSLVALSNVISALVFGGGGGGRGRYVPYRDSALTWLLKDCFTGGAATFIIATLSPSSSCYGESASTLRWAARARQLPTPRGATTNSSARAQTATSEQLATLKSALLKHHIQFIPETGALVHDPKFWILKMSSKEDIESVDAEEAKDRATHASNKVPPSDSNRFGSTASSITSTSSDRLDDKHLKAYENTKNPIDHMFGPVLERTVSGHDLKVAAPLRNKRKQYRSHDVLPTVPRPKVITLSYSNSSQLDIPGTNNDETETKDTISVKSEEYDNQGAPKIHVPYQMENPRAEIVASVTERLYTTLKKKEESPASKVESVIDKKIMEPLHELKICTNARQRLVEMSQRAFRSKRKIGIPAYTQTRFKVTRMKDTAIDVQEDLEPYCIKYENEYKYYLNVHTETQPFTPRCKDVAVGSAVGSLYCRDVAVSTDPAPSRISNSVMTEDLHTSESSTQTTTLPPPRKKKMSAFTKYLAQNESSELSEPNKETMNSSIINISISQTYPTETESLSDDSLDECTNGKFKSKNNMPPDLLSNHNSVENQLPSPKLPSSVAPVECNRAIIETPTSNTIDNVSGDSLTGHLELPSHNFDLATAFEVHTACSGVKNSANGRLKTDKRVASPLDELFSDNDERGSLPRSSGDTKFRSEDLKNMILGRNINVYPYNIIISPPLSRLDKIDNSKKAVTFSEDVPEYPKKEPLMSIGTQTALEAKYMEATCCVTSSENLSTVDSDDFNKPAEKSFSPRLEHSRSFSYIDGLSKHRYSCNNALGVRRKSDLNIPNLKSSNLYKPKYRPRSPSYQSFKNPLSESEHFKDFVLNDNLDSLMSTSVTSELCDQSDDNICTQSSTSMSYLTDDYSDYPKDFKDKKKFFEDEIRRIHEGSFKYHKGFNYYAYGSEIMRSCDQLEKSIARHENYISLLDRRRTIGTRTTPKCSAAARAPSEYLQHLIQVRREVVNTAKLNDDASFHSFHGYV